MGNLQTVTQPNGVVHSYAYDQKNRLTNLAAAGGTGANPANFSYGYTLDNAGHRTSVMEKSGRAVNYSYDSIYRLTSETIASDPGGNSGAINYTYDPVGNRTNQTSTVPAITSGGSGYDADDRLTLGDTYDANGNTTSSGGIVNSYDFENHLVQQGGASVIYDGDGNRVQKTVAGIVTKYLVLDVNPTGYAQVGVERITQTNGVLIETRGYVYGLERVSQKRTLANNSTQTSYYVYDGHGSVRALADQTGSVTDTYDYDAFGNTIHSTTTLSSPTPNEFLFAGEQYDSDLHLYYNRARYLNVTTGRFWTMDTFEGDPQSPASLHKYLYASDSPVDSLDPSGRQEISLGATSFAIGIAIGIAALGALAFKYYLDKADANVEGVAAQQAAEPMVAAALTTLQDGAHVALFQQYFGPPIPSQIALVTNNYEQIVNCLTQQISFYHVYTLPWSGEFAESVRHGPLKIGLGPSFFEAPLVGRDSKAGTIIHELSHIELGTLDYAYGVPAVLTLSADQAANNADTYEYYAEDSYTILYGSASQ